MPVQRLVRLVASTACALAVVHCGRLSAPEAVLAEVDPRGTIYESDTGPCARSAGTRIVTTGADWRSLLAKGCVPGAEEKVPVDFSREMVVVATSGGQPTAGRSIRVERAGPWNDSLMVVVRADEVRSGCAAPAGVSAPVHVVRLPRSSLPPAIRVLRRERCPGGER